MTSVSILNLMDRSALPNTMGMVKANLPHMVGKVIHAGSTFGERVAGTVLSVRIIPESNERSVGETPDHGIFFTLEDAIVQVVEKINVHNDEETTYYSTYILPR